MNESAIRRAARRVGLVLLSASLVACTTVRPVTLGQSEKPSIYGRMDDLHLGDKVTITKTDDQVLVMQITALQRGAIEGKLEDQPTTVRLTDQEVKDVQRVEVSGPKSSALIGAGFALMVGSMLLLARALGKSVKH